VGGKRPARPTANTTATTRLFPLRRCAPPLPAKCPQAENLGSEDGFNHSQSSFSNARSAPTTRTKTSSKVSPPARSSSSVPSATTRPSLMMAARSQSLSTTSSTCEVKKIVAPSRTWPAESLSSGAALPRRRLRTVRPQKQFGMMDQSRSHGQTLSHPLGVFGYHLAPVLIQLEQLQQVAGPFCAIGRSSPYIRPVNSRNSLPRRRSNRQRLFRNQADAAFNLDLRIGIANPSNSIVPAFGIASPVSIRIVVDLPPHWAPGIRKSISRDQSGSIRRLRLTPVNLAQIPHLD